MKVNVRKVLFILIGTSVLFGVLFLLTQPFYCIDGQPCVNGDLSWMLKIFDIDNEVSLPTWYSTILLFVSALGLAYIAMIHRGEKAAKYWWGLAGVMTIASIDEGASLHERIDSVANLLGLRVNEGHEGIFIFDWWVFLLPVLFVILLFFIKFLWGLPRRTKILFGVSLVVFVFGAVFFEALGGLAMYNSEYFEANPLITVLEECFEMIGSSVFIYAILDYISKVPLDRRKNLIKLES